MHSALTVEIERAGQGHTVYFGVSFESSSKFEVQGSVKLASGIGDCFLRFPDFNCMFGHDKVVAVAESDHKWLSFDKDCSCA